MTKPKIKEVNAETGEEIIRDATAVEIALMEADEADYLERKNKAKAEAEAKAAQKAALLERLGITEFEARLLLS